LQTGLEKELQQQPQLQYLKSNSEDLCFEIKKFVLIGENTCEFTFAMQPVIQSVAAALV
jgi:hemolysin activation/secretion protein